MKMNKIAICILLIVALSIAGILIIHPEIKLVEKTTSIIKDKYTTENTLIGRFLSGGLLYYFVMDNGDVVETNEGDYNRLDIGDKYSYTNWQIRD